MSDEVDIKSLTNQDKIVERKLRVVFNEIFYEIALLINNDNIITKHFNTDAFSLRFLDILNTT